MKNYFLDLITVMHIKNGKESSHKRQLGKSIVKHIRNGADNLSKICSENSISYKELQKVKLCRLDDISILSESKRIKFDRAYYYYDYCVTVKSDNNFEIRGTIFFVKYVSIWISGWKRLPIINPILLNCK